MYFAIGFALMLALSFFDYHVIEKLKTPMLILIIVLMLAVVIWGVERNGAKRWLDFTRLGIPLSFQPSEMAKFVLVLYMASFMSKRPQLMASFSHGIVPMLIIMGVFGILLLAQKNMSMMVIMVMTGAVMLFFGGDGAPCYACGHSGAGNGDCGIERRIQKGQNDNVLGPVDQQGGRRVSAAAVAYSARFRRDIRQGA